MKLKVLEKEEQLAGMTRQIEDLKQKAEQGSQQLQGEVQELALEAFLHEKFPMDQINPVAKGVQGADVIQYVFNSSRHVGTIVWESKRTKLWSDGWLQKLKDDQRVEKAEIAVLVTQTLPKGMDTFGFIEGVWVVGFKEAIPVAFMLRQVLIEVAAATQASEGQQTKAEMVYQYLTGSQFKQRIQAIVEGFSAMQADLILERKAITKQWAKRDSQIERVMQATVGMYGDLQGIAGKTLQEIEGLALEGDK